MSYLEQWARAFGWTLGIEWVVAGFVLGAVAGALPRRMLAVLLAQCLSHPAVWFILPELGLPRVPYLLVAESWALLSEWLLYSLIFPNIGWRRSLLAATAANAASYLLGLCLVP